MKKLLSILTLVLVVFTMNSCSYVEPNYYGVLQENYGKAGKSDFSLQAGKVSTLAPGTELFQVPAWEQRAEISSELHLKSSEGTEFTAKPKYSYKAVRERAVDLVFDNKHLGSGSDFMTELQANVLDTRIYDITKEYSKGYKVDELMAAGGTLKFEKELEALILKAFAEKGLELKSFEANIDFEKKVKERITKGNEVNANIATILKEIEEQKVRNVIAQLEADENLIRSKGLTDEILKEQVIQAWREGGSRVPNAVGTGSQFLFPIK